MSFDDNIAVSIPHCHRFLLGFPSVLASHSLCPILHQLFVLQQYQPSLKLNYRIPIFSNLKTFITPVLLKTQLRKIICIFTFESLVEEFNHQIHCNVLSVTSILINCSIPDDFLLQSLGDTTID